MPQCPTCQSEVDADYSFCPNCGARLAPATAAVYAPQAESWSPSPEEPPKRSRARIVAAAVIIVLLLAVSAFVVLPVFTQVDTVGVNQVGCPAVPSGSSVVGSQSPNYDLQEVMVYTQTYPQLEVNVTAVAQCDVSGYGPAYLLNGLTNTGYWYQVGIDWNWPLQSGGYAPGFGFVSEAWAPGGFTHAPPSASFSGNINQGDTIELRLYFSVGQIVASALDLNTSASGSTTFPSRTADTFIGSEAQHSSARFSFATQGYFTGLMTEWYHVGASGNGPGQKVTYSENTTMIATATLGVGEWNFTAASPSSVFSVVADNGSPIDFSSQPNLLQQFALNGYTLSADAYEFVTGS